METSKHPLDGSEPGLSAHDRSERRWMEEQRDRLQSVLLEGEERLQTLLEDCMAAVYLKDREGRYLTANHWAEIMFRRDLEEVVGKTDHELWPKEVADVLRANDRKALETEAPLRFEQHFVHEDGEYIYSATKFPLYDSAGDLYAVCGIATDFTKLHQAEKALEESEERFRSVVHNSSEIVKIVEPDGTLRYASPALERVLGYRPEALVGKNILEYVHPDDLELVRRETEKAMSEPGVGRSVAEYRFLHADGTWRYMESVGTYLLDEPAIRGVVINIRDVTERKEAEEALKESEERYRRLVENSPETIVVLRDEEIVFINAAGAKLGGVDGPEDLVGKPYLDFIDPDHRKLARSRVARAQKGKPVGLIEQKLVRPDGRVLDVEAVVIPITHEGKPAVQSLIRDITERKKAEGALKKSEERFKALIQNSSDIITVVDAENTIIYQSPSMKKVLGHDPEERIGQNAVESDLIHPEDLDAKKDAVAEAVRNPGVVVITEVRMRRQDGSWRHVEQTICSLLEDPNVSGIVFNARDITERKEAEARLRESEERFRGAFENAPIGMALVSLPFSSSSSYRRYLRVNRALCALLGYSEEELLSKSTSDITHPEDRDISDVYAERLVERGRKYDLEKRYIHADGHVVWCVLNVSLVRDSEGDPSHYISQYLDITERKRAEEALRKSEASLAEAQRIARLGSWEWDMRTSEVFWSDEVFRIYGFTPGEFVPTFDKLMEVVHPDDRELVEKNIEGALYEGEPYDFEHRVTRPDGEERIVYRRAKVVFDEGGEPLRMIGTVHDITERKRAEETLRESEVRYRAVVEQSVESIFIFNPDTGRVLESNTALQRLLGYTPEELCEMEIYDIAAHGPDEIDSGIRRDLREKRRFAGERKFRRKDGSLVDVEVSMSVIPYRGEEALCTVARDVTERKALEDQLRHRAFHDPLTDLPNRALFLDRLHQALGRAGRLRETVAVLFVDLDDFKVVNDSLGHDAGNLLLVEVGARLRSCVRPGDTVARLFGDEFAVLLEAPTSIEDARRATDRIGEYLRMPFDVNGEEVFVSSSVGIALSEARGDQPKDVLRRADLAMYAAKSHGKGGYDIFTPSMDARAAGRLQLETELRRALEREEFEVYYQPIVELGSRMIHCVEALVRWRHPEKGLIFPSEFIALAEKTGLIRPMGQWVLEKACRQAREWHERYPANTPMMSVNFTTGQFSRNPDVVSEVLIKTGLDPEHLQLEITERAVMDNPEFVIGKLKQLKDLGVRFAIDDYGVGYSCLHYLKRIPVDFLKIDRSFIIELGEDPGDTAIVAGTIDLGHALGLEVVAEGVETAKQLAKLEELGCDLAQGFYFTKPLPNEAMSKMLAASPGRYAPGSGE